MRVSKLHNEGNSFKTLWLCALLLLAGCLPGEQPARVSPTPIASPSATAESGPAHTPASIPSPVAAATQVETAQPISTWAVRWLSTSPTPTQMPVADRERIFEEVWQAVNDYYIYADFNGLDWEAVRQEYEPRVESASSSLVFYSLLSEMVGRLDDEHSYYLTPWDTIEQENLFRNTLNYVGIGILTSVDESAVLVTYVVPGNPAAEAGLQRRDRIIGLDGKLFKNPLEEDIGIRGPEGTFVRLTVESPGEEPREIAIPRRAITGSISPTGRRLEVDESIGYLIVPGLNVENMGDLVEAELEELLQEVPLQGLILDLRANSGGWRTVLEQILGLFVSGEVGSFYTQSDEYPLEIFEGRLKERLDPVPLVVLVDALTESYAEVMAATLRQQGRAQIVGSKSRGNTETVQPHDFEDGSRLWIAEEGFRLPNGTNLEGRGVIPDEVLDVVWARYTERNDPHILKALQLLRQGGR